MGGGATTPPGNTGAGTRPAGANAAAGTTGAGTAARIGPGDAGNGTAAGTATGAGAGSARVGAGAAGGGRSTNARPSSGQNRDPAGNSFPQTGHQRAAGTPNAITTPGYDTRAATRNPISREQPARRPRLDAPPPALVRSAP